MNIQKGRVGMAFSQTRFKRLIEGILQGSVQQTCFQPWEVELLLDIQECSIQHPRKKELLRRYQKAALRHSEAGAAGPLKFSDYLKSLEERKARRARDHAQAGLPHEA